MSASSIIGRARCGVNGNGDGKSDGRFEIFRSLPIENPVSVTFGIYGNARLNLSNGTASDYTLFIYDDRQTPPVVTSRVAVRKANGAGGKIATGTVTIPAYADHVSIEVVPRKLDRFSERRSATFILEESRVYDVVAPSRPTIRILPSPPAP